MGEAKLRERANARIDYRDSLRHCACRRRVPERAGYRRVVAPEQQIARIQHRHARLSGARSAIRRWNWNGASPETVRRAIAPDAIGVQLFARANGFARPELDSGENHGAAFHARARAEHAFFICLRVRRDRRARGKNRAAKLCAVLRACARPENRTLQIGVFAGKCVFAEHAVRADSRAGGNLRALRDQARGFENRRRVDVRARKNDRSVAAREPV